MQPRPLILFTWDGWWQDMACTFLGPSSLFQRWNINIRSNYGLIDNNMPTNTAIQILLVVRRARSGSGLATQGTRVFENLKEIEEMLRSIPQVQLVSQDLSLLSFNEQVRLVGNSSLVIGVHGAGISNSMHMPVGTKYCCGVIEIFPEGEFKPIRGYGNMARRMGHHYERLDLGSINSKSNGARVPVKDLQELVLSILKRIEKKPSCVLKSVIENPYLSSKN